MPIPLQPKVTSKLLLNLLDHSHGLELFGRLEKGKEMPLYDLKIPPVESNRGITHCSSLFPDLHLLCVHTIVKTKCFGGKNSLFKEQST